MRYYLTTAIDYVNSRPHLGTAYEKMTADVLARYHRGLGKDVLFLMGNDEHSQSVAQAARDQGLTPLEHCDRMEEVFRAAWSALDVVPTDFIRTTEERHKVAVREMANRIRARGDLFQGEYEGWYCVGCEAFKRPEELREGKCPEHLTREPQWLKEKNWFFRLSAYREKLLAHYEAHPEFVQPEFRKNELLELLHRGLEDISVSRASVDWGVPFPFDPSAVVYVWFDALINYVSGTGWPTDLDRANRYWPADLHLIGKDITRFHCVIWPAMLLSAGLPLPRVVFGHGYVNMSGGRMSKSAGRAADPVDLATRYGADALRYFVCAEASFGQDLEYTEERLRVRANAELANGLGNLASRVLSMIDSYQGGEVGPAPTTSGLFIGSRRAIDDYVRAMDSFDLRSAVSTAMAIVDRANQHVDRTQPFILRKDPARKDELQRVLAELLDSILIAAHLLYPVMPRKMTELHRLVLGTDPDPSRILKDVREIQVPSSRRVSKSTPLFPRIDSPTV